MKAPSRLRLTSSAMAGLSLVLAACAPATPPDATGDSPRAPSGPTVQAAVVDTAFEPLVLKIERRTTVEWIQTGSQPHSVTDADDLFDSNPTCSPLRSDECLGKGDSFSHTFDQPGEFLYYCRVHGLPDGTGMVARVIVE